MRFRSARLQEVWHYGQTGAVNAAFGFLLYSLLVRLGVNIFQAQIAATIVGVAFNYVTYSRHVFRDAGPAKLRFLLSSIANYLVSLAMLAVASRLVTSPYLAGLLAIVVTAAVNYVLLKYAVFTRRSS